MKLRDKVVVITGAGSGIGRAMAVRFAAEGARVAISDLRAETLRPVELEVPGTVAIGCDVSREGDVRHLVAEAKAMLGPIDLFCANAGVAVGEDPISTANGTWGTAWRINVQAHVFAARALLDGWLTRGAGYFLSTASAAGLLSQIGSAPYAVTKHATVAFAEWLSLTYRDRGIKVSCLCPMGVNTPMLTERGGEGSVSALGSRVVEQAGAMLEPEDVADIVVRGLDAEQFLILPHPQVLTFWQRKTADYDRWLAGMNRLQASLDAREDAPRQ